MIRVEEIRDKLTPYDLYKTYLPDLTWDHIERKKNLLSCFKKEQHPSLSIYRDGKGEIKFKCHSSGHQGDMFEFFAVLEGLDPRYDFRQVLESINEKFRLGLNGQAKSQFSGDWISEYYEEFTPDAIAYWEKFRIGIDILKRFRVQQLKRLNLKGHGNEFEGKAILAFEYRVNGRYKLYVPKQSGVEEKIIRKTQLATDIFGLDQMTGPRKAFLLICEGEKDALCANSHGIPAVSFQSANAAVTQEMMACLFDRAHDLIICYDNDDAGRKAAEVLSNQFGIALFKLDEGYKDIAEYLPGRKPEEFKEALEQKLKEFKITHQQNIWERGGRYWAFRKKREDGRITEYQEPFTNFTIEAKAFVSGEAESKRVVRLHHEGGGKTDFMAIHTDVFVSPDSFVKFLESKGNFFFFGTRRDLLSLKQHIFRVSTQVDQVEALGWHGRSGKFVLSNGVISGNRFLQPDNMGIVENLYLPFAAPENEFNSDFATDRQYRFKSDPSLKLADWTQALLECYGNEAAVMGIAYLFSSLSFDFVSRQNNFFPLFMVWGQKSSGKTSYVEMLFTPFGPKIDKTDITNMTSTSLTRKMAHTANLPQWFDEFKNSVNDQVCEVLKGVYNLSGRATGTKDNTTKTKQTRILSSAIVSGQEIPTWNEALLSRMLIIQFNQIEDDQEKRKAYHGWRSRLEKGLGHILIQFLSYRDRIVEEFNECFARIAGNISQAMIDRNLNVKSRLIDNYATILTPLVIAINHDLPLFRKSVSKENDLADLYTIIYSLIECQAGMEAEKDEVNVFWETLASMKEAGIIQPNQHIRLDRKEDKFGFKPYVLDQFQSYYYRINNRPVPDKEAVKRYMQKRTYYKGYERMYFQQSGSLDPSRRTKQERCHVCIFSRMNPELRELIGDLFEE